MFSMGKGAKEFPYLFEYFSLACDDLIRVINNNAQSALRESLHLIIGF